MPSRDRESLLPRFSRAAALVAVWAAGGSLSGCYERVVAAEGPGTQGITVYEPNMKSDRWPMVDDVEDAIFGQRGGNNDPNMISGDPTIRPK